MTTHYIVQFSSISTVGSLEEECFQRVLFVAGSMLKGQRKVEGRFYLFTCIIIYLLISLLVL